MAPADAPSGRAGIAGRMCKAVLASLPCIGILAYFVILWHGMVPPSFAQRHSDVNLAAIPFFAAIVALYGVFYLPMVWSELRNVSRAARTRPWLWVGALAGLASALISATDWNPDAGRVSGLWNLARLLPSWHHRSLLISGSAVFGGLSCALWLALAAGRLRVIVAAAAVGFVLTQCLSHFVYERYYAGLVFLLLLMLVREYPGARVARLPAGMAGPLAFAVLNACILAAGLL